jgi:hypothetical protein
MDSPIGLMWRCGRFRSEGMEAERGEVEEEVRAFLLLWGDFKWSVA